MSGQSTDKKTSHNANNYLGLLKTFIMFVTAVTAIFATQSREVAHGVMMSESNSPNLKSAMIADSTKPASGIKFENTGLGPLIIKDIQFYQRGSNIPVANTSYHLQEAFDLDPAEFTLKPLGSNDAITHGKEHWLVKSVKNDSDISRKLRKLSNNMSVVICYCSLNGKCNTKVSGVQIKPVMACS